MHVVANTSRKDGASAKKSKMIRNTRITKMPSTTLEARGKGLQLYDIGADDNEKTYRPTTFLLITAPPPQLI